MRKADVLKLPSMPMAGPSYPAGPYRFINREFLVITYETDPALIRAGLPEPLEPIDQPIVKYEWIKMPDSSGSGSFAGVASFYGNESGSKTASGQRFNENDMTAAHRSLPFGTKVRVTHRGKSVVVTINDRGPFVKGRVLDLSTGAARAVGLTASGVGHVTAEVL